MSEGDLLARLSESLSLPFETLQIRNSNNNENGSGNGNGNGKRHSSDPETHSISKEIEIIEKIVAMWVDRYTFPKRMTRAGTNDKKMSEETAYSPKVKDIGVDIESIASGIISNRLTNMKWISLIYDDTKAYSEILPIIQCIRLFVRDQYFLKMFIDSDCIKSFATIMNCCANRMIDAECGDTTSAKVCNDGDIEILVQCVAIIKRISSFCLTIDNNYNRTNVNKSSSNSVAMLLQQNLHITLSQLVTIHNIKYEYTTVLPTILLSLLFMAKNSTTINDCTVIAASTGSESHNAPGRKLSCLECVQRCCLQSNVVDSLIRILELSPSTDSSNTDTFYLKNVVVQLLLVLSENGKFHEVLTESNCALENEGGDISTFIRQEMLECGIVAKTIKLILQLPTNAAKTCPKDSNSSTTTYLQPLLLSLLSLLSHLMSENTGLMEMRIAGAVPVLLTLLMWDKSEIDDDNDNDDDDQELKNTNQDKTSGIFSSGLVCCIMSLFAKLATDDSCAYYIRYYFSILSTGNVFHNSK